MLARDLTPTVNRTLEVADDCEPKRSQPRRRPIDPCERASREVAEAIRWRSTQRRPVPSTRNLLGEPIKDGSNRARQDNEPEEHAKDMPLRQKQTVFYCLPYDFGLIEICS